MSHHLFAMRLEPALARHTHRNVSLVKRKCSRRLYQTSAIGLYACCICLVCPLFYADYNVDLSVS